MIRRFYVHNFRCLENFELDLSQFLSVLLIGKNGAGKSTVGFALEILQRLARGENRVGDLIKSKDIAFGRSEVPMRFEIEVELGGKIYQYSIALELPEGFRELRIFEERLVADGAIIYTRERAQVSISRKEKEDEAKFRLDWHLAALPIVQERSTSDPLFVFKQWLARMIILRPTPSLILGASAGETLQPDPQMKEFGAWFSGLFAHAPAAYAKISELLKSVMPDFGEITNPVIAKDARNLVVRFSSGPGSLAVAFEDLSDGEKCFMIWALTLAANETYGPLFCFWDEPDNYLALSEIEHLTLELRKQFATRGQFMATSHNPEAIRCFSDENTFVLHRRSHMEPTLVRSVADSHFQGDLIGALTRGALEL